MTSITNASMTMKILGAMMVLTLIAAAAAAITLTAGPTQAQDASQDQDANHNFIDAPPCGPGADTAFMEEPHERTTGHFALFDTYWEKITPDPGAAIGLDQIDIGILHTNTCPPLVIQTVETDTGGGEDGEGEETTKIKVSYIASGVDIDELIIHVEDLRKVAVVATNAEATSGQLSLERYPELQHALGLKLKDGDPVPAGTEVWWLRTDDPNTATVDESAVDDPDTTEDETATAHSNGLSLGFTTWRLNDQDWARNDNDDDDDAKPLHYAFELERERGIPLEDHAHMLSYRVDSEDRDGNREIIWNSAAVHIQPLEMEPGQFESLEWIFTDAGTYELSVHLIGWVKHLVGDSDHRAISGNVTETSEVKAYTIQVGDELLENEPPVFGVSLTVPENSPAGTLVGAPIPIFEGEADTFYYNLSGEGHEHFEVVAISDPHSVQIQVADGADLDYETKPVYEFRLNVTDGIDHESNHDLSIDDSLAVRITLKDIPTSVTFKADNHHPSFLRDQVTLTAALTDFGEPHPDRVIYHFSNDGIPLPLPASNNNTVTFGTGRGGAQTVDLYVTYLPPGGDPDTDTQRIDAEPLIIHWRAG